MWTNPSVVSSSAMKLLFTKPLATNPSSGLKTRYNSLTHKYTCIKKKEICINNNKNRNRRCFCFTVGINHILLIKKIF